MKKKLLYIILIITGSALTIFFLNSNSPNRSKNGFRREIISTNIVLKKVMELPDKSFVFAGKLDNSIKLNRGSDRLNLYQTDYSLKKLDTIVIKYPKAFFDKAHNIYKSIFAQNIYCTNLYGDVSIIDKEKATYYKLAGPRFDHFQVVSPKTLLVRARNNYNKKTNRSLARITLHEKVTLTNEYPLPNLSNGLFANDGILFYDEVSSMVFYMYAYRGEFLCLDSNLNLKYIAKTIDTVRSALIKTSPIKHLGKGSNSSSTIITPPKFVNVYITINNNKVYIYSRLKAENETSADHDKKQSIDVYRLNDGKYLYSFHIPKYLGKNLRQFQIKGNTLVAIFGTSLVTYDFEENS